VNHKEANFLLCQECNKKRATVHLTKVINNEKETRHLCEQCAREKGDFAFISPAPFSIHNLLAGLLNTELPQAGQSPGAQVKIQCENCGLTYAQFGQIGRFGCSRCYPAFKDRLVPLLRRLHGSAQHAGKVPRRTGGVIRLRRDIGAMRHRLQACVAKEEFEEAAALRDEIRRLEASLGTEGGGKYAE
jgi:protein arginine kinase activator